MRRFQLFMVVCATLVVAAGCSVRTPPTGQNYYAQGQLNFANHEYRAAIENYQYVIDKFPFSPYAEDAEMKIGLAYYQMGKWEQAIAALDDFQHMHPTSKNLELVSYYIAMSYFNQIGREDQDQSKSEQALTRFQAIEQRFPESEFAELAREQAQECREMLARHDKLIGDFYFQRANFRAAESRYAELMDKYADTPVAPDALWELAVALDKEGKKYSAAEAFAAMVHHFPKTRYATQAKRELKTLDQPVDTEEDPLKLVLAENGYGEATANDGRVIVRQRDSGSGAELAGDPAYGPDGLPILKPAAASWPKAPIDGPAKLKTIRLASSNPPLSVVFDLSGPVQFENHIASGPGYSTLTLLLKHVTPGPGVQRHLVFDRSIFRDCDVSTGPQGTTVTLNTSPVTNFAVVPLEEPPRLLVTFTPESNAMGESQNASF
jgi:outer membrane protein assembly factor BamD